MPRVFLSGGLLHSLLSQVGGGGDAARVDGDADVELGDGDLEAQVGELGHACREVGGHAAADKVRLKADTVQGCAGGEELLGNGQQRLGLCVHALEVVVVDVQLDVGRGGVRVLERKGNVVLAQDVVPDRRAPGAIVEQGCGGSC